MVTTNLQQRYQEEREKRINIKGLSQYLDNSKGSLYALDVDPWVPSGTQVHIPVPDGGHAKIAIFGAGLGGLCAAVRCLEAGAAKSPEDIVIIDPAGGFGGTWWWNRYPGINCDIESYVYIPLLEETGYMPKRKYSDGKEIRAYCNLVADQYGLHDRALFQSSGKNLKWQNDHWSCEITVAGKGTPKRNITIDADFVIIASGTFTYPKLPNLPGLDSFKGKMIHCARWDYETTGGSQDKPVLDKLSDKRVAFIGTGATAIQAVPNIAKYAKELYVVQRTPSAVDVRNNRDTDPEEWKTKIANKKGWQAERAVNFQIFSENPSKDQTPQVDLVDDGWTHMPSIAGGYGQPSPFSAEQTPQFLEHMYELDAPRSDRVRQRVVDVVEDEDTAKKLQAWYAGWCKRPCFHDEYLPAFNLPSTHLVDTEGKGIEAMTENGIVANGKEYPVDIVIWGTGYGSPLTDSLAGKAEMTVIGKNGADMDKLFKEGEVHTLHGISTNNFPNVFSLGLSQAGLGINQTQRLDDMSQYVAYTICEARKKTGSDKVIIEANRAACDKWADEILSHAYLLSGFGQCTPGYFTLEGDIERISPEQAVKVGKSTIYGRGYMRYVEIIKNWQKQGGLEGLDVKAA